MGLILADENGSYYRLLHFKNLLHQHIGPEFSQDLFSINSIDEKQVLVVNCEPAKEPAFLKVNKDDEFFIRSGPSNIRLSTSQVLKSLASRQEPRIFKAGRVL